MIYVFSLGGEIIVTEHIPARVNSEIGEWLFAPETVEKTQVILRSRQTSKKIIQTLVFDSTA